jgi:hypothetical protein
MTRRAPVIAPWLRVGFLALAALIGPRAMAYAQVATIHDLSGRLDPQTALVVQSLVDSATSLGIPSEPLVAKALEGQSKGASGERIAVAVRNLAGDLNAARIALGTTATSAELVAGAGALRSGASSKVLARLKAVRGTHSVLLPLATLTDLISRGVPAEQAEATVLALAERGATEADYRGQLSATAGPNQGGDAPTGIAAPAPTIPRPPTPTVPAPGNPADDRRPR